MRSDSLYITDKIHLRVKKNRDLLRWGTVKYWALMVMREREEQLQEYFEVESILVKKNQSHNSESGWPFTNYESLHNKWHKREALNGKTTVLEDDSDQHDDGGKSYELNHKMHEIEREVDKPNEDMNVLEAIKRDQRISRRKGKRLCWRRRSYVLVFHRKGM